MGAVSVFNFERHAEEYSHIMEEKHCKKSVYGY